MTGIPTARRFGAIAVTALLTAGILAGCSSTNTKKSTTTANNSSTSTGAPRLAAARSSPD